jgi:hypothetical protein
MTTKDCVVMLENGILPETVHMIHGPTITCTLCKKEQFEKIGQGTESKWNAEETHLTEVTV